MSGTRAISTTSRRDLSGFFFLQGKAPKKIHAILKETLACFLPGRVKDLSAPLHYIIHFNNIETRAVIKFFFLLQCKAPKEIHANLREILACFVPGRTKDLSAPLYYIIHFNNIETRAVIKFFFSPAKQGAEGNSRHSDRNISLFPSWSG